MNKAIKTIKLQLRSEIVRDMVLVQSNGCSISTENVAGCSCDHASGCVVKMDTVHDCAESETCTGSNNVGCLGRL